MPRSRCRDRACCRPGSYRRNTGSACVAGDCRPSWRGCAAGRTRRPARRATAVDIRAARARRAARSVLRTSAPIRKPPSGVTSILSSASPFTSMRCAGFSISSFMRSSRLVPPAMNLALGIARRGGRGRGRCRRALVGERSHALISCRAVHFGDGLDDVRVRAAAADVAAHAFADFRLRGAAWVRVEILASHGSARSLDFLQHRHRGADLSRRAIPTLEAVVLDERRLHGMHLLRRAQALDGGDASPWMHDRQRQTGIDAPAVRPAPCRRRTGRGRNLSWCPSIAGARATRRAAWCGCPASARALAVDVQRNGRFESEHRRRRPVRATAMARPWRLLRVSSGRVGKVRSHRVLACRSPSNLAAGVTVFLVADFLHPDHFLLVESFVNCRVAHRPLLTGAVPMLDARRCPHDVTGTDRLAFAAFPVAPIHIPRSRPASVREGACARRYARRARS